MADDRFTELAQFEVDPRSVRRLAERFCREHQVVVLGRIDGEGPVAVGMLDPTRHDVAREVATALGRPVRPVQLNDWEIRHALAAGYPPAATGEPAEGPREGRALTLRPVRGISFEPEHPVAAVLDEVLGRAVQLGASDVHVECYENDVDVRLRIDGVLRQVATPLASDNVQAALARLKVLADLDIAERRHAQDGRIKAVYREPGGRERGIDFRLSVVPGPSGEDAVLRILDSSAPVVGLEKLGMPEAVLATFQRMIANPEGLVLVTGPTGSGKTTTLYAAILRINTPENKILTVEDPIEYYFAKVNQKQVSSQMGFADYARSFMRQNPDVILIGEIRDEETAEAALRAAQTGHLVFSTLHTNDAVRTVSRLATLGVDRNLIAGSLLGAVSQRLLRRLCPQCRVEAPSDAAERAKVGLAEGDGPTFVSRGCDACRHTGYKGRVGVFELFAPDGEIADAIAEGAPIHQVRSLAREKGMRTLLDDALDKAKEGVTSLAEIRRAVPYRILEAEARPRA